MATLVLVTVAMRVLFTRECFRQRSGHTDKPVLNVCANLHKCKMKLLPVWGPRLCDESGCVEHFHGGGNHQHVDHATNILMFSRIEGQMSSCAIEQIGTDALSRLRCSPADTRCFKKFVRRSNRAQHTSIERHGTSSVMTRWAVCTVAMKVTEERTTVLQPYFYTREERLDRATKGSDPRTEQTSREPDWGNLARYDRARS